MAFLTFAHDVLLMLQPEATRGAGGGDGGGGGPGPGGGCAGGLLDPNISILLLMLAVVYFIIIRPQNQRQKQHDQMVKSLEKGTAVRTTGGIRGEIVDLDETDVVLLVAEKTRIRVLRNNVASVEKADDAKTKETGK